MYNGYETQTFTSECDTCKRGYLPTGMTMCNDCAQLEELDVCDECGEIHDNDYLGVK